MSTRKRYALIREGRVVGVVIGAEDMLAKADKAWVDSYERILPLETDDDVRNAEPGSSFDAARKAFARPPEVLAAAEPSIDAEFRAKVRAVLREAELEPAEPIKR